jgi:hypothetical protein
VTAPTPPRAIDEKERHATDLLAAQVWAPLFTDAGHGASRNRLKTALFLTIENCMRRFGITAEEIASLAIHVEQEMKMQAMAKEAVASAKAEARAPKATARKRRR